MRSGWGLITAIGAEGALASGSTKSTNQKGVLDGGDRLPPGAPESREARGAAETGCNQATSVGACVTRPPCSRPLPSPNRDAQRSAVGPSTTGSSPVPHWALG